GAIPAPPSPICIIGSARCAISAKRRRPVPALPPPRAWWRRDEGSRVLRPFAGKGGHMLTRAIAVCLIALGTLAGAGPAAAEGRLVVYSSNDAHLNRFVFDAFTRETGIPVDPVEGGSGVLFRRIASQRQRPLRDVVWGGSPPRP